MVPLPRRGGAATLTGVIHTAVAALVLTLLAAPPAAARLAAGDEVRVTGVCGGRTGAELRAKPDDGRLEVRFGVERASAGRWTVVLVHERRVAWRGSQLTRRGSRSFEVRRLLPDLAGADTVVARAWGPRGVTCRAAATVR
jgi:hypothetical protein